MRADEAPVGERQVFISQLRSEGVFPVSPKAARILGHILAEILPDSLQGQVLQHLPCSQSWQHFRGKKRKNQKCICLGPTPG